MMAETALNFEVWCGRILFARTCGEHSARLLADDSISRDPDCSHEIWQGNNRIFKYLATGPDER
jgi:hypothetical protein